MKERLEPKEDTRNYVGNYRGNETGEESLNLKIFLVK